MLSPPESLVLQARRPFDTLLALVEAALNERIERVEGQIFAELLGLGLTLLRPFIAQHGSGDAGPMLDTATGTWQRLEDLHPRRYLSIFDELTLDRTVYGTRAKQKIQAVPLDAPLGLPEGDFSYLLQSWRPERCLDTDYAQAVRGLARAAQRPPPQGQVVWAEMRQEIEDEEVSGCAVVVANLFAELDRREPTQTKAVLVLWDGERALWTTFAAMLARPSGAILDWWQALTYWWLAAKVFHGSKGAQQTFVTAWLRLLVEGKIGGLITGLKQMGTQQELTGEKRRTLAKVVGYLENNRAHMAYDVVPARGLSDRQRGDRGRVSARDRGSDGRGGHVVDLGGGQRPAPAARGTYERSLGHVSGVADPAGAAGTLRCGRPARAGRVEWAGPSASGRRVTPQRKQVRNPLVLADRTVRRRDLAFGVLHSASRADEARHDPGSFARPRGYSTGSIQKA